MKKQMDKKMEHALHYMVMSLGMKSRGDLTWIVTPAEFSMDCKRLLSESFSRFYGIAKKAVQIFGS